ncbi:VOC family protein [Pedobacter sandarakinus]|uniref:VOC family protein n=1 Tax=Pedobacter sandarakinus TaxID=353156 RepID=UPI00224565EB|nr:VOC family protein [Pedobacter sandarakinus]MCX2573872.1 VOC family protein [Pedobacter sandarakinus]
MIIKNIDRLVLTVANVARTSNFYTNALGMELLAFENDHSILKFGAQEINIQQFGQDFGPKAYKPTPGSASLCFSISDEMSDVMDELMKKEVEVETGPTVRTVPDGKIVSIYLRDPDCNLIELRSNA